MTKLPEFIDFEAVNRTDEQIHQDFMKGLRGLFFDYAEADGTMIHVDSARRMRWKYIGRGSSSERAVNELVEFESKVDNLVAPLLGRNVLVRTTNYIKPQGEDFVESEEFSPLTLSGSVQGTKSVIAKYTANIPIGFGDYLPGPYPKKDEFEHYRICMLVGEKLIPMREINGNRNTITLVENQS